MKKKEDLINRLTEEKTRLEHYKRHVLECLKGGDWHGVQDAGADLGKIEQNIETLLWVLDGS